MSEAQNQKENKENKENKIQKEGNRGKKKEEIVILGGTPLITGFKLAGLKNHIHIKPENYQQKLEELIESEEYGIIITNEKMLNNVDPYLQDQIDELAYPVIVPLPDVSSESTESEKMDKMIKRALGFDLGSIEDIKTPKNKNKD